MRVLCIACASVLVPFAAFVHLASAETATMPPRMAPMPLSGLPAVVSTTEATTTTTEAPATTTTVPRYAFPNADVEQWHDLALVSGWSEAEWPWVACVIFHESRGRADTHAGVMQILWDAHEQRIYDMGGTRESLRDPGFNMLVASAMFHEGQRGRPWHNSTAKCEREGVPVP